MKVSNALWKDRLAGKLPENLAREVDIFETELGLRTQGKLDERLFAETCLRRGVYGQRYDNGQRHDGAKIQELAYPSGRLTKGPNTLWGAPGPCLCRKRRLRQLVRVSAAGLFGTASLLNNLFDSNPRLQDQHPIDKGILLRQ